MATSSNSVSLKLLGKMRDVMAREAEGQTRLDQITELIAHETGSEVCSIYLVREKDTLELCATHGLNPEAVHQTRMRIGDGLVGRVARTKQSINTADAPTTPGFRYMPETGEEIYSSFLGVLMERQAETFGVLVVQSKEARAFDADEVDVMEIVAMVLAEMAELGEFVVESDSRPVWRQNSVTLRGIAAQEGVASGRVWLHEPRVVVTKPIADDIDLEIERLGAALDKLRNGVDRMLTQVGQSESEQRDILQAYALFAASRGWRQRMEDGIRSGLSAEAAVEREQSATRARLGRANDGYLRDRLHDLDDLSNRLLRILTGQSNLGQGDMPDEPILVARNIGPAELLDYGRSIKGIVLEHGSVGSHAAIVARALAIPLVIQADKISTQALNGDQILVDGDQAIVHLRPEESVRSAFHDKTAMAIEAQQRYASLRSKPARTKDGAHITLMMNAGLMADLPSLESSGAEGVGLFRTELQFLIQNKMPRRSELRDVYARVMDAANGKPVAFRTLDIGSDKVLPYMKPADEPNPALGWRAIRVGLDKPGVMRMQIQALIRAAAGRPLFVMFPFVAQLGEFQAARDHVLREIEREKRLGHPLPAKIEIGTMLETPSLAFAPRLFFELTDFVCIGGNDLKQLFYAADRENERVRRRYDTLNVSFLTLIEHIVSRCVETATPLSFCGEDAGRPLEALCFSAMGIRQLSMRPASIGPVKNLLRRVDLKEAKSIIDAARASGVQSVRPAITDWLRARQI